jgi:serine/threonine protein kinase
MDNFVNFSAIHQSEFATVKRACLREDNKVCVLKCLDRALLERDDLLVQAELECEVLSRIACPYIVPVRGVFCTETSIVQVLKHMRGDTLFRRILEEGRIPESRARLYAAEILFALHYLHSKGIVHRNLRPENVLLDGAGHAMLSNFALVKTQMYTARATATDFCGGGEYIAPEILRGQPHTRAVDWWYLGVLLYHMLEGVPPFVHHDPRRLPFVIVSQDVEFYMPLSADARDLIVRLLQKDPGRRLGGQAGDARDVMSHPFFASINFSMVRRRATKPEWAPKRAEVEEDPQAAMGAREAVFKEKKRRRSDIGFYVDGF